MSRVARKHDYYLCKNKVHLTAQLISAFVFGYTDITTPPLFKTQNFKILAFFCVCIGRFVSDLVGNPDDRFSHVAAQIGNIIS